MYDYRKDDEQLSEKNDDVGDFWGWGNTSSNSFKVKKEDLPGWAIDWARDRFNMDAQNVKFYVMDEEDSDEQFAMASGDSIFMASGNGNDEELIKHELTHIYQQAIGTATESNADDTSLEEEAINVSKESENIPVKGQAQRDKYIIPKEKTNVVQYRRNAARDIAKTVGLAVGGILTLGILPLGMWLAKQMKYKRIADEHHLSFKKVKKISNSFSFVKEETGLVEWLFESRRTGRNAINIDDMASDAKVVQRLYTRPTGTWEYRTQKHNSNALEYYNNMLELGFEGFGYKGEALGHFGINLYAEDFYMFSSWMNDKLILFMQLYTLTKGFKNRKAEDVANDFKILFGKSWDSRTTCDHPCVTCNDIPNEYDLSGYERIYNATEGFSKLSPDDIIDCCNLFGDLNNGYAIPKLMSIFHSARCENKKDLYKLGNNILKIAKVLGINYRLWKEGRGLATLITVLDELTWWRSMNNKFLSYLVSDEIIPIIKEVAKTDKNKGKYNEGYKEPFENFFKDCIKKIDGAS